MRENDIINEKEELREFIEKEIKPYEKNPSDFLKCWPALGEKELFGLLAGAYDKRDRKLFDRYRLLIDELCKLSISGFMLSFLSQGWVIECLRRLAENDYHNDTLKKCIQGRKIGAFCLTEQGYGSSYTGLTTTAVQENGKWNIKGEKIYITNGSFADCFIVIANTTVNNRSSISFFLLEKEMAGVSVEKNIDFIGNPHAGISKIKFNCLNVDQKHLLGKVGNGFFILPKCLNIERMDIAFFVSRLSKECLKQAFAFVSKKKNQEKKIIQLQTIRHKFTNMFTRQELLSCYINSTIEKLMAGEDCTKEIVISKISATETASDIILEAAKLTGAYGFTCESGLITKFNDIAPLSIGGGANDVLRDFLFKPVRENFRESR